MVASTIVQFDKTIVLPRKLSTGSIHDYLFYYCPLVDILFEALRMVVICCMLTGHKAFEDLNWLKGVWILKHLVG